MYDQPLCACIRCRLILALIEADPNAARRRQPTLSRISPKLAKDSGSSGAKQISFVADVEDESVCDLPRDIASTKGAPFNVMRALVELTPYKTLLEATEKNAHEFHVQQVGRQIKE